MHKKDHEKLPHNFSYSQYVTKRLRKSFLIKFLTNIETNLISLDRSQSKPSKNTFINYLMLD